MHLWQHSLPLLAGAGASSNWLILLWIVLARSMIIETRSIIIEFSNKINYSEDKLVFRSSITLEGFFLAFSWRVRVSLARHYGNHENHSTCHTKFICYLWVSCFPCSLFSSAMERYWPFWNMYVYMKPQMLLLSISAKSALLHVAYSIGSGTESC